MIKQRTIKNTIHAQGIGLHTGKNIKITLHSAPEDTGIVFRRVDIKPVVEIPALAAYVGDTSLSTTLVKEGVRISTVEHLLSAFAGMHIDNAYVDIDGPEVPIMDGSAGPFIFLLQAAGFISQEMPRRFIRIKREIKVAGEDKWVKIYPYSGFKVGMTIDFRQPINNQTQQFLQVDFNQSSFVKEISRARTFGFLQDAISLKARNLALGGSLDNAIVVDKDNILNKEGLRYKDEFVKHKILDVVGDLYLLGHSIIGGFEGYRSGHTLNNRLLKVLLSDINAWEEISLTESQMPILAQSAVA